MPRVSLTSLEECLHLPAPGRPAHDLIQECVQFTRGLNREVVIFLKLERISLEGDGSRSGERLYSNKEGAPMIVRDQEAKRGQFGEKLHVKGDRMEMRFWENIPPGFHFDPHDFPVDIAGFVVKGKAKWTINGREYITSQGDSYYLPTGCFFGLDVIEEFSVVEVLSPPRA
jgi:quercetin dioxygenase-like cupin family protein